MSFEALKDERDKALGNFTRPVTFTLAELWLLNDFTRHEISQMDTWKYPPASRSLNQEIALAIVACVDSKLKEYTLELCEGDLLVIDYNVRRELKTPEGAHGDEILLKCWRALRQLAGLLDSNDYSDLKYSEVIKNANNDPGPHANDLADDAA